MKKMSIRGNFEKWHTEECYITYYMDFRFVPCDPVCFGKLSILISKQVDDGASAT